MLSILDIEFNKAIDAAVQEVKGHATALRSQNGDGDSWVWPCAKTVMYLAGRVERLKRVDPMWTEVEPKWQEIEEKEK